MKKILIILFITFMVVAGLICFGYKNQDAIYVYYQYNFKKVRDNITIEKNEYFKNVDYKYVQNTDDFLAKDKKHLINIFYTIVNSGVDEFTFYCDDSYTSCIKDTINISNDDDILSTINNFVHPYNSFENLEIGYDKYGKIAVNIDKVYNDVSITDINQEVSKIIDKYIKDDMSDKKKVEVIHDYIINHGTYATDSIRKKYPKRPYNRASDILISGEGLCSAYADAMAIFLDRFGITNYKIASESHIWNLVKIKNKWYHLDVTWDDPVTRNGVDRLISTFFLITTDELEDLDVDKHEFNKIYYSEAK